MQSQLEVDGFIEGFSLVLTEKLFIIFGYKVADFLRGEDEGGNSSISCVVGYGLPDIGQGGL
ncbi:hypothetical protein CEQ30_38120 [Nocardia brasiliensis]|nr:hypothetical protein CEQ30_38120 [Nocardia brasiliensis]